MIDFLRTSSIFVDNMREVEVEELMGAKRGSREKSKVEPVVRGKEIETLQATLVC